MPLPVTLAIDTGQARCQCAIALPDGTALSLAEDRARGHAEVLIGQVETLLGNAGIAYPDIDRVAATTGPGSFTGLRVGLAAARGFGLALSIPVLGVGTLSAMSLAAPEGARLCVLVDAKRGEAWRQSFSAPGVPASPPEILALEAALAGLGRGARVLGSASALAADRAGSTDLELLRPEPDRGFVPVEALARFAQGLDPAAFPPEPTYVRAPDARPQASRRLIRQ